MFASYVFIASTIPDIRDREGDALTGVRTIPVILGAERTKTILTMVNFIAGGAAVFTSARELPLIYTLLIGAAVAYIHLCIHSFYRLTNRDIVCDLLSDGQFILFGSAVWVLGRIG